MSSQAVFWDRDNTLIEDPGYIRDPKHVQLLPGAAEALKRISKAGFQNIVTTNQSGVARGLLTEEQLAAIHERLKQLLAEKDAAIDAIYYCPYLDGDQATIPKYRQDSDLRKPKPGMLVKASLERDIDLIGSWTIGDSLRDAQAGRAAGCRTILIAKDSSVEVKNKSEVDFVVGSLNEAVETVLKYTRDTVRTRTNAPDKVVPSPVAAKDKSGHDKEGVTILQEILAFLRMVDKRSQAEDFSLARLAGAVVQIMALAAMIWAVFAILRNQEFGVQIVRLLFGLLLQMLALTFFMLSSRK